LKTVYEAFNSRVQGMQGKIQNNCSPNIKTLESFAKVVLGISPQDLFKIDGVTYMTEFPQKGSI